MASGRAKPPLPPPMPMCGYSIPALPPPLLFLLDYVGESPPLLDDGAPDLAELVTVHPGHAEVLAQARGEVRPTHLQQVRVRAVLVATGGTERIPFFVQIHY